MKKFPRNARNRKGKPDRSDRGPDHGLNRDPARQIRREEPPTPRRQREPGRAHALHELAARQQLAKRGASRPPARLQNRA